jgi:hypothetical protein
MEVVIVMVSAVVVVLVEGWMGVRRVEVGTGLAGSVVSSAPIISNINSFFIYI